MLTELRIDNFRCIHHALLDFDAHGTGIVGGNASGKTSLLEAIFFIGHGRSFRTNARDKLLRRGADAFQIIAQLDSASGSTTVAGVEYRERRTTARLAGAPLTSWAAVAALLPLQVIDPGIHRLVEEGSALRRRLMDWGVFHVKQSFVELWRKYHRALQQRNSALRQRLPPGEVRAWDPELVKLGEEIDNQRREYVSRLQEDFGRAARVLLDDHVSLEYRRGWPADETLEEALCGAYGRDCQLFSTTRGPHRADLTFVVDGMLARDRVSRGQQKLLAAALVLSQVSVRNRTAQTPTTLLLDDPAAELDVDNLGKLLRLIEETPSQLIATSVNEDGLRGLRIARKFHVEQGAFRRML